MIDKETFHPLNYIKKEEYSGSMDGMRYMLKKVAKEGGEEDEVDLLVTIWPDPLGIHATPESEKQYLHLPLTAEGVAEAADWLNEQYLGQKERWDKAMNWRYTGSGN